MHGLVQLLRDFGPLLRAVLADKPPEHLILDLRPLGLVAAKFLDEEPPLLALLRVLRRDDVCDLLPVGHREVLDTPVLLDHIGEQSILEEVSLIVLPLSERALALEGVLGLVVQLLEDVLGLLVADDRFAVELVLAATEPHDIAHTVLRPRVFLADGGDNQAWTEFLLPHWLRGEACGGDRRALLLRERRRLLDIVLLLAEVD